MVVEVTSLEEYEKILKDNALVCVDYFATWCGPCKVIAPEIEKYEKEFPKVKFLKVDVDKGTAIAEKEGISAMPTFKFFKNGEKVKDVIGASKEKIRAALESLSPP